MGINLFPTFYLIKAGLPGMLERRSSGIIALGGQAEMSPYNIRGNMENPGSTDTERAHPEWYPEFQRRPGVRRRTYREFPWAGRRRRRILRTPACFFASDESAYITGDRLNVMGDGISFRRGARLGLFAGLAGLDERRRASGQGLELGCGRDVAAMRSNRWA